MLREPYSTAALYTKVLSNCYTFKVDYPYVSMEHTNTPKVSNSGRKKANEFLN